MIRGVLKPMPEYPTHIRAGITIPKTGREFLVDDEAAKAAQKDFSDVAGSPLVLSTKGYEYMKEANGTQLMIEPIGGASDGLEAFEETATLRVRVADLEQELASAGRENQVLLARISELEASAPSKGKGK